MVNYIQLKVRLYFGRILSEMTNFPLNITFKNVFFRNLKLKFSFTTGKIDKTYKDGGEILYFKKSVLTREEPI